MERLVSAKFIFCLFMSLYVVITVSFTLLLK